MWLCALVLLGCGSEEPVSEVETQFPVLHDMVYLPGPDGRGLLVDRFEVTDAEFHQFVHDTGYGRDRPAGFLTHWTWPLPEEAAAGNEDSPALPAPSSRNTPVVGVNLRDAKAYAAYRGKSIPTVAEWKSMIPGFEEGLFPWSEESYPENCNVLATGLGRVTEVGVFEAGLSESGCYDLIGNVWEWAINEGWESERESPARVMGGAFTTRVRDEDRVGPEVGGVILDSRTQQRHPDERSFDIGFRCVIRDADQVLEECLDQVESMRGAVREQAIRELLRVGKPSRGTNRVLPFVAEREFRTRKLWSVESPEVGALLRSPVPLQGAGGGEDLLVVSRGLLQGLSGVDGHGLLEVSLPSTLSSPEIGLLGPRDGKAWFWTENSDGGIRLVDLPEGLTRDLPAPPEEQISEAIEAHLVSEEGILFVQSLYQESGSLQENPERDLVRLQIVRRDGSQELLLPGVFDGLHLVSGGRALVSTSRAIDLTVAVPFGRDGTGLQPEGLGDLVDPQVHGLFLVDLSQLRVVGSRQLAAHPIDGRHVAATEFVSLAPPSEQGVLVALAQLTAPESGALADKVEYKLLLLDLATLETRTTLDWATGRQGGLAVAGGAATYLGLTGDQTPVAFVAIDGQVRELKLEPPTSAGRLEWSRSGGDLGPLLFARDRDRFDIQRLQWSGGRPRLLAVEAGLTLTSEISQYLGGAGDDSRLALVQQSGRAVGVDLRGGEVIWEIPRLERSGEVQLLALDRDGEDLALVGPPPASSVWWRDWATGRERGRFQVRRAPIGKFALADITGDDGREWVVSLSDPAILEPGRSAEGDLPDLIVSLGEPDPQATRLLDEFRAIHDGPRGIR